MSDDAIIVSRRITTEFLYSIPELKKCKISIYAVVKRKRPKNKKWQKDVRIDPCILDMDSGMITMVIPKRINIGINSIDDLEDNFYDAIQAAFLSFIKSIIF